MKRSGSDFLSLEKKTAWIKSNIGTFSAPCQSPIFFASPLHSSKELSPSRLAGRQHRGTFQSIYETFSQKCFCYLKDQGFGICFIRGRILINGTVGRLIPLHFTKKALDRLQISSEVSGKYELTLLTERLTISLKMSVLEVNLMQGGTFGKYIE